MAIKTSTKTLIWNIVKTTLMVIIAIALIKVAFFPSQKTDEAQPVASFSPVTVEASKGDISNKLILNANVVLDAAQSIKSTMSGTVKQVYVDSGAKVSEGDALFLVRKETPQEPLTGTDDKGMPTVTQRPPIVKEQVIKAPVSGTVTLDVMVDQEVMIASPVGSVQPNTYSVRADLQPDQLYRLASPPESATVTIKNGPAPFECKNLKVKRAEESAPATPALSSAGAGASTSVMPSMVATCSPPSDVKVFAGLSASMEVVSGSAKDAVLLPVSAVEGRFQSGYVYLPPDKPEDEPKKIPVKLGVTDGDKVQITEGVKVGDKVLQFAPGQNEPEHSNDGM